MSNHLLKEIFNDINPIPQDDGPNPICSINYTQEFTEAMGYLRAILRIDERSQRALDLTTICLKLNPANYTTWHFRRRCLAELSSKKSNNDNSLLLYDDDLIKEDLELTSELGGVNPKNYQIWYHRRALLEPLLSSSNDDTIQRSIQELKYVATVFDVDPKNYHAWSHRQWILRTVNNDLLWKEELKYICILLDEDIRNNSAWNQRWFVVHRGDTLLSLEDAKVEVEYAFHCVVVDPYNESPWRYFIGILTEQFGTITNQNRNDVITFLKTNQEQVDKLFTSLTENNEDNYYQLLAANIDVLEMIHEKDSLVKAARMANELATIYDTIRAKYWLAREMELLELVEAFVDN